MFNISTHVCRLFNIQVLSRPNNFLRHFHPWHILLHVTLICENSNSYKPEPKTHLYRNLFSFSWTRFLDCNSGKVTSSGKVSLHPNVSWHWLELYETVALLCHTCQFLLFPFSYHIIRFGSIWNFPTFLAILVTFCQIHKNPPVIESYYA